jgi:hypothetical protein
MIGSDVTLICLSSWYFSINDVIATASIPSKFINSKKPKLPPSWGNKGFLVFTRSFRVDITRDLVECLAPIGRRPIRASVSVHSLQHRRLAPDLELGISRVFALPPVGTSTCALDTGWTRVYLPEAHRARWFSSPCRRAGLAPGLVKLGKSMM